MDWTPVPGYEFIEVTRCGKVRSCAYSVTRGSRWNSKPVTYHFPVRELRQWLSSNGYVRVVVQRDGKRGPIYLHRLIAFAFVPGYIDGYHVNHINGVKTDNRPENLEWVPIDRNTRHQWETGLVDLRGERSPMAKLSPAKVRAIRRMLAAGVAPSTIATVGGVAVDTIRKIQLGQTWQSVQG